VAADGTIGAARGVPANTKATVASGTDSVITVPFAADVSACAATASPAGAVAQPLTVAIASGARSVVITEPGQATAVGFHLQVTC